MDRRPRVDRGRHLDRTAHRRLRRHRRRTAQQGRSTTFNTAIVSQPIDILRGNRLTLDDHAHEGGTEVGSLSSCGSMKVRSHYRDRTELTVPVLPSAESLRVYPLPDILGMSSSGPFSLSVLNVFRTANCGRLVQLSSILWRRC